MSERDSGQKGGEENVVSWKGVLPGEGFTSVEGGVLGEEILFEGDCRVDAEMCDFVTEKLDSYVQVLNTEGRLPLTDLASFLKLLVHALRSNKLLSDIGISPRKLFFLLDSLDKLEFVEGGGRTNILRSILGISVQDRIDLCLYATSGLVVKCLNNQHDTEDVHAIRNLSLLETRYRFPLAPNSYAINQTIMEVRGLEENVLSSFEVSAVKRRACELYNECMHDSSKVVALFEHLLPIWPFGLVCPQGGVTGVRNFWYSYKGGWNKPFEEHIDRFLGTLGISSKVILELFEDLDKREEIVKDLVKELCETGKVDDFDWLIGEIERVWSPEKVIKFKRFLNFLTAAKPTIEELLEECRGGNYDNYEMLLSAINSVPLWEGRNPPIGFFGTSTKELETYARRYMMKIGVKFETGYNGIPVCIR